MVQAFDTLAAAKRLHDAGMEQAQAGAGAIREGQGELVTKTDLRAELAVLEARLNWRIAPALTAQGALVIAAVKLIP